MCRIFALRSTRPLSVKPAFDGLRKLAAEHKDGWGVATFEAERPPSVETRVLSAEHCERFNALGSLEAQSVMVHIRLASVGTVHERNNHPFAGGRWVFMHNGTLKNFESHRKAFEQRIAPRWAAEIRGETDSERCFALFRTYLGDAHDLESASTALVKTFRTAEEICDDSTEGKRSAMNFLVSDGVRFFATRRDRTLFVAQSSSLVAIASEALPVEGAEWVEVPQDSLVTVDAQLAVSIVPIP